MTQEPLAANAAKLMRTSPNEEFGQAVPIEAPEIPALAPEVQFLGEMQGSGFRDRQYLVQRGSRFLQLTEILYCVAEQVNGERTLEEIAAKVSESTDWLVTVDNVRQIILTKLIPLGIVAMADGSVATDNEGHRRSPLAVNLRMKVIGAQIVDPVAKVLQVLFALPILIPALIVIAIAHWWLYFSHGIFGSLLTIIYTPALILVIQPLMLLAGIFHEFGHAAALRYGGGRARGMGMGLYLVYPVFYTDTTESYRLGRWARVRTDLGGFYFHLIFTLGVISAYLVSGWEFLLIMVPLINFDIIRQMLPFVRFDGYWALADLTGLPDLFSQMGAFLRSIVPIPGSKGTKLPNLRPWVKIVFGIYVILTIPVLSLLLFFFITRTPRILAAIWDSFGNQVMGFVNAQANGNFTGLGISALQMFVLMLQMLAIIYLLYRLSSRLVRVLWSWSKPTGMRRVIGAAVGTGLITLVTFLWLPQLPWPVGAASNGVPVGVQTFEVAGRAHVESPVSYTQVPPVGGDHAPIWQNCGFYSMPIASENGVHSMEHGAVWITYQPGLDGEQVDSLRKLSQRHSHILVSPFKNLPAPVVASAWGPQLPLDSVEDPRLEQFVRAFRLSEQAPENGGPCTNGIGEPG